MKKSRSRGDERLAAIERRIELIEANLSVSPSENHAFDVQIERVEPLPDAIVVRGSSIGEPIASSLTLAGVTISGVPTNVWRHSKAHTPESRDSFSYYFLLDGIPTIEDYRHATLSLAIGGGLFSTSLISTVARRSSQDDAAYAVFPSFIDTMTDSSRVLEIGSRARLGTTIRQLFPGSYLGIDILNGPNVDRVADAHLLSEHLHGETFTHAVSASVFEHLVCPIQAASELNAVLEDGALVYISTHQTWGHHEQPWDYFRFSDSAWYGIFNRVTGYEILEARLGDEMMLVPLSEHGNPALNRMADHGGAYATSVVLARKISPSTLPRIFSKEDLETIYIGQYPH